MTKGSRTRETILDQAVELASVTGLGGVSIGTLATHTGLSKSGLFAHFGSKETLQVETLRTASRHFVEVVVSPALEQKAGLERMRALFENWVAWSTKSGARGGCLFVASAVELDDQAGPARDYLVEKQREWLEVISRSARRAIEVGAFRDDLDTEQFAHDLYSIFLGFHHARRLLQDPKADARARAAFANLLRDAQ
jgi:AcrR family transcriptional regulator